MTDEPIPEETPGLPNPELDWDRSPETGAFARSEVEDRIGRTGASMTLMPGGRANLNVLIGGDRVLRIFRRQPRCAGKEALLLGRPWRAFRVPRVLRAGPDFLLLEHVPHRPLPASAASGARLGTALAEIHRQRFAVAGFLDEDLGIQRPLVDFCAELIGYARTPQSDHWDPLRAEIAQFLENRAADLRPHARAPVLLHGDYKATNLHATLEGELLVLDWEFAYSGPALMDVGQLFRWGAPEDFGASFAEAYRAAGGSLPDEWLRLARTFDLANLMGLLRGADPESRRARDLVEAISSRLEAQA